MSMQMVGRSVDGTLACGGRAGCTARRFPKGRSSFRTPLLFSVDVCRTPRFHCTHYIGICDVFYTRVRVETSTNAISLDLDGEAPQDDFFFLILLAIR